MNIFPINSISSLSPLSLSIPPVRVRVQGTETGLQAASLMPLAGSCLPISLEAPWPSALFSSFPNEVGKVNTFGGGRKRGLLGKAVRQACGCQPAEGCLPNSRRV